MHKLTLWVLDRGLASAVTGPIDVLAIANSIWSYRNKGKVGPLFEWRIESVDGAPARTACGVTLPVDGKIDPNGRTDILFLSGIFADAGPPAIFEMLDRMRPLLPALRKQHRRGTVIAANCTATFVLAETGLLDHRPATTSWWLARAFRERYPSVNLFADEVITEKDRLLCSGATTAHLNLALRLVEKFAGASLARSTAKTMLIDTNRLAQGAYKILSVQEHMPHSDAVVLRAQRRIETRLHQPFSLGQLAHELSVSKRTIIRRFKKALGDTPLGYVQGQRIELAKRLLETTRLTIDAVSERVGYTDLSAFRRLFKRETGISPSEFQRVFTRHRSSARGVDR